ncbi:MULTISPECIES: sodium:alanine symporter family protein [unclassified Rothia (in: high G+C Gram-positive bacteria)]|uniref:alanine/glycine:cation symporter family protein n=1 Tax=unclassified Rothia (in: high G+C Gram-positive bacteria) TaxID=2689056 RepID=UPI001958983D|nr:MULTISPECIES: alanine/glycine:cation symporter family protein [unclassified Rothia (in: high G+C Gram-positive bacteria)]MBM7052282.1 alanine:cation symporter family protein [Rothia sp. ZJ1223]QRZ61518.1 alanine:cation symporter family protein [Rothia sp. ZJ932]
MDAFLSAIERLNSVTAPASDVILDINNFIWGKGFFFILTAIALIITFWTRGIQFRGITEMFRTLKDPAGTEYDGKKSISAFRAFTVSAASRVGTGNIAGVALAITMGGPGAVFWMWVIASIGAASAFAESLLGQLYKERGKDSYIGGPAYYMKRGLKAKWLGFIFVAFIVVTYAFVFVAVQTNSIVDAVSTSFAIDVTGTNNMGFRIMIGLVIMAVSAAIIFGGIRAISSVTEILVPVMAVLYVGLGVLVIALNLGEIPGILAMIFEGAFGLREFGVGGLMGALVIGMRRGLLSNEAGMGTAPNAGATAVVSHPAKQGFVQALGVYFDTLLICSITAFIVLLSNPSYGEDVQGAALTQTALAGELGNWAIHFLSVAITLFAFSSIIGNYYYGESNIRFVTENKGPMAVFRIIVLLFVFFGAIASLDLLWNTADLLNAGMVITNLVAVLILMPQVSKVLKNYEAQRAAGKEPVFHKNDLPEADLAAWDGTDEIASAEFWETRAMPVVKLKEARRK